MRKYLLPFALTIALASGLAFGQNINKALQLSQDATGQFGVDTSLGVYFPGHILSPQGGVRPAPTVSSGATTPSIAGTDTAGLITVNAAATTVTATFGTAYVSAPNCVISASNPGVVTNISWVPVTTSIAVTFTGAAGTANKLYYWCSSAS